MYSTGVFGWLWRLRRRVRLLAVLDGLASAAGAAGLIVILAITFDYVLEPGAAVRRGILGLLGLSGLALSGWFVVARLAARLEPRLLAQWVERRRPELADRLLTAVELTEACHPYSPVLTAQAANEAARQLDTFDVTEMLPARRVTRRAAAALVPCLILAGFALLAPDTALTWWRRGVLLSDELYPRQTHLAIEGFDRAAKKIAKGSDFELVVAADAAGVVPVDLELRYRTANARPLRRVRMPASEPGRYRFVFSNVLAPIEFQARGGDATTEWHTLLPVDPPALTAVRLTIEPPAYTGRKPMSVDFAGVPLSLPLGSTVTVAVEASMPLGWLECRARGGNLPVTRQESTAFRSTLNLVQNVILEIAFADLDGIEPREPMRLDLLAVPDKPPTIRAQAWQVSHAVTRSATVPVRITAEDDYGLVQLRFVGTADKTPIERAIPLSQAAVLSFDRQVEFPVADYNLEPGQKLTVAVVVADGDTLHGPHEIKSEPMAFDIVTTEELLVAIAGKELQLRQRFEQVIAELEEARQIVSTIQAPQAAATRSVERLRLDRAMGLVRRCQTESAGVAEGFRDLVAELRWNRITGTALLTRMEQGVIEPLDRVLAVPFPRVAERLREFRDEPARAAELRPLCEQSMDRLLAACRQVLGAMRKLESFNEAVAILRGIIADEQSLGERIKAERRRQVLELLK